MDDADIAGLTRALESLHERLGHVETSVSAAGRRGSPRGDLEARMGSLIQELAELRRANLLAGLQEVETKLEQRINLIQQLGDEWAALIAPVSRAGGLRGLNAAVDVLTHRVQRLTLVCAAMAILIVVMTIAMVAS